MRMTVALLYLAGCPNYLVADQRPREALRDFILVGRDHARHPSLAWSAPARSSRRGSWSNDPTNQEAISKSRGTPIHRS